MSAAATRQTPVQLRVAVGDIVAARASLIAVGHVNGLRPDGAERALDTALDDDLRLEGRLFDRIHEVNVLRKESGLEITDRIRLWVPDEELLGAYGERLAAETLAVEVAAGELRIEKA